MPRRKKKSLFIAVDNDALVKGVLPPSEAQFACWAISGWLVDEAQRKAHRHKKQTDMHDLSGQTPAQ